VPNPGKGNDILFQNYHIVNSSSTSFSISVGKYCPSPKNNDKSFGSNTINIGDKYYHTASPAETVYALVYQASTFSRAVSFDITITPVTCAVPTGLTICKAVVTYPTDSAVDAKAAEGIVALATGLGGCNPTALNVFCGAVLPKCDDNNFPTPPCATDCQAIRNGCSQGLTFSGVCPTTPIPNSYCYANAGAVSLGISIRVMAVLAILVAFN